MIDQALRGSKKRVLAPTANRLRHLNPALFTLAGLLLGLGAAILAAFGLSLVALGLWLANRVLDGLDGEIARSGNSQSDLGGYLDMMSDLVVYAAVPLGLALWQNSEASWLALGALLASFYLNTGAWMYLSALLEKRQTGSSARSEATSITMPRGLIEGAETILFYCLFLIFPGVLPYLFWTMALLVFVTALQRVVWAGRHL